MPNIRQYRNLSSGDNDWLSEPPKDATDDTTEAWEKAWDELRQANVDAGLPADIKVEFSEDIYTNEEYLDPPEWIAVKIEDSGVLPFKMAQGIIKGNSIDGLRSMEFSSHFSIWVAPDWGGYSYTRLQIYEGQAYVTFSPKHASGEVEVNITEQFNQAIGE